MINSFNAFRFGEFILDARRRRLMDGERTVHLKPKEWDLLHYLIERRERLVEKGELIDALWPRQTITEANLTQTVYRVRQAIDDSARNPRWIETVSRLGYRFSGEVETLNVSDISSSPRSVAMLPFTDIDEQAPSDWSLELTESVNRMLAEDPELEVRPLSAVMRAGSGQDENTRRALRVDALIDGEISQTEDAIRVVANLLDGRTGTLRWSKSWVMDPDDGRRAQERIARDLQYELGSTASIGRTQMPWADFETPEARTAYLRGRYCWNQFTESSLRRSIELFDQALALSPRSAKALAWRSGAWAALGNIGALTPRESAERARRDADRAIAIDDDLAAGFEMLGVVQLYFDWNLEAALKNFEFAIQLDGESANAHHLRGNALAFSGNFAAALLSLQRAELIDPTSLITLTDIGLVHYLAGNLAEARERLEAVLAQNEHFAHARLKLAFVMAALNQPDEALHHASRVRQQSGSRFLPEEALFYGLLGKQHEAQNVLKALANERASESYDPYSIAIAHLGVSDHQSSLTALEEAVEFRSRQLVLVALDPVWAPLRAEAAFHSLVARIGLVPPG